MARTPKVEPTSSLPYYAFSDNDYVSGCLLNSDNKFRTMETITEVANEAVIELREAGEDVDEVHIWVIHGERAVKYSLSIPSTVIWTKV